MLFTCTFEIYRSVLKFLIMDKKNRLPILQAIIRCKCPVCTRGDMFKTSAFNLKKFNELKERCDFCGFNFQPEPGFYQISLYFTYMTSVSILIIFGLSTYFILENPPLWVLYIAVLTPVILSVPWNVRYSKVLMLYIFGGVSGSGKEKRN